MKKQHKRLFIELNAVLDRMIELKKLDNQSRELKLKELEKVWIPKYPIGSSMNGYENILREEDLEVNGKVDFDGIKKISFPNGGHIVRSKEKESEFNPEEVEKPDSKIQMSTPYEDLPEFIDRCVLEKCSDFIEESKENSQESIAEIIEKGRERNNEFFEGLSKIFKPDNQK